jgi:hypothetical protein
MEEIDRYFHINRPYFSAGIKYGWGNTESVRRKNWGIGLAKDRIDFLAETDETIIVKYGKVDKEYTISARKVKLYPVEEIKGYGKLVYIIPKSILNYRKPKKVVEEKSLSDMSEEEMFKKGYIS